VYASNSALSPDDHWLAYFSNTSARNAIFVQPFPTTGAKYQLPAEDARDALWSPDGKELFYAEAKGSGWQLMVVPVQTTPVFAFGQAVPMPVEGFIATGPREHDVSADGKQLAIILPKSEANPNTSSLESMNVTLNWFEELKARVTAQ